MSTIRDRILDAVYAALNGSGSNKPAGLAVTEERLHPTPDSRLPILGLYFEDEEPLPLERQQFKAPIVQKLLALTVEYRALATGTGAPPQTPRKAIDPLYLWVMQQLGADETLGGLAMGIIEGPTKWLSKEADSVVAAAAQKFTIHYRTSRLNPSTAS